MTINELKQIILQGERVDVECKKAENNVPKSVYETYLHLLIQKVVISYLVSQKINK